MKQVRTWLLAIAALTVPAGTLMPNTAWAQPKGKPAATSGAAKPGSAKADAAKPAAAAGGVDELDGPTTAKPADTPAAPTDMPTPGAEPSGGICEIDPSACPKAIDVKKAAERPLSEEVSAVQQIYALRYHRLEINPYWSATLNDQFVSHPGPGLALNYYMSNVLALGVSGTYYGGLNGDSDFNFQNRRAARIATPLNEYLLSANFNMTYVPVYGKFAGFSEFIFHYDFYVIGGIGMIWNRPIPVVDPDNRKFDWQANLSILNPGVGLRIFFNRWFAVNLEIRDYIFIPKTESLVVATTTEGKRDSSKWFGPTEFTNNIQAQIGVSFFLPPSWEYRLPK